MTRLTVEKAQTARAQAERRKETAQAEVQAARARYAALREAVPNRRDYALDRQGAWLLDYEAWCVRLNVAWEQVEAASRVRAEEAGRYQAANALLRQALGGEEVTA